MIRAAILSRASATGQTVHLFSQLSNGDKDPAAGGSDSQMLTWAQCLSRDQPCLLGDHPRTLPPSPRHTPGPGTRTGAPGPRTSWPFAPFPLRHGEISWGLGKKRPFQAVHAVIQGLHTFHAKASPSGCDWHSHPQRTGVCSADAVPPAQEAASTLYPKSSPHGARAAELRSESCLYSPPG